MSELFTRLYRSLNQQDVVNGILEEKFVSILTSKLKKCSEFEQKGDWEHSFKIYQEELISTLNTTPASCYEDRFIVEAYFKVVDNFTLTCYYLFMLFLKIDFTS